MIQQQGTENAHNKETLPHSVDGHQGSRKAHKLATNFLCDIHRTMVSNDGTLTEMQPSYWSLLMYSFEWDELRI